MYFLKRAFLYVRRKKSKVITIGIILFVVSALVLTGLVIQSASNNTFEVARQKLGATVLYTSDLSSVMEVGERTPGMGRNFTLPDDYTQITTKEIEYIAANSEYVKDYVINASLAVTPVDFSYYNVNEETTNSDRPSSASMNILGSSKESVDTIFNNENNTLVSGSYFTDNEINDASKVVIIEQTIATLNEIKVGDTITVSRIARHLPGTEVTSTAVNIEYEVVGIYKTNNPTDVTSSSYKGSFNLTENTMYAPYTTVLSASLEGLTGTELEDATSKINTSGYTVDNVTFNLIDPSNIEEFIAEVKAMENVDTTYRLLSANDAAYEKMVGPIENVAKTSTILVVVVVIAGALIIALIAMLSIKDRKYELGVLLSLGESKTKIIAQLISEMVIVAIVSFSMAAVLSNFTAQATTNYLLNQELTATSEEEIPSRGNFGGFGRVNNLSTLNVETIDELTVTTNSNAIIQMFAIGLGIIVVGNITQALFVLKANPKEILLER